MANHRAATGNPAKLQNINAPKHCAALSPQVVEAELDAFVDAEAAGAFPRLAATLAMSEDYWQDTETGDFHPLMPGLAAPSLPGLVPAPKSARAHVNASPVAARLEELRVELRAERISWGELAELQSLAAYIEDGDVELLEAAGVPE